MSHGCVQPLLGVTLSLHPFLQATTYSVGMLWTLLPLPRPTVAGKPGHKPSTSTLLCVACRPL